MKKQLRDLPETIDLTNYNLNELFQFITEILMPVYEKLPNKETIDGNDGRHLLKNWNRLQSYPWIH